MLFINALGTYLPDWGCDVRRTEGAGEDVITLVADGVMNRFTNNPRWVSGVGLGLGSVMYQHKRDMTIFPAAVQKFFTGVEMAGYLDPGFADRFEAHTVLETAVTSVGGALPVNPSGGIKAKGHPQGATGVTQCVELFGQLRSTAVNQVDGARIALAHNIGGPTAVSAVTILEGPGDGE